MVTRNTIAEKSC